MSISSKMNNDIRLVVADDNLFFAEALAENLSLKEGLDVKEVFSSIDDLIRYCNSNTLDVLILDVNFRGQSSLDSLTEIRKEKDDFKIIILTTLDNDFNKSLAQKYQIDLFLSKENSFKNFSDVIFNCFENSNKKESPNTKGVEISGVKFTDTKIKVLRSLYKYSGKTEGEIAGKLNISESSLKTHKRQLYEMTNTKRITDLIKFGFENGILLQ